MKDLDDYILEIFSWIEPGRELRWFEIRNELLNFEELNPNFAIKKSDSSFNVRVSRALKRLAKQGILETHEEGHKQVSYSLGENAPEKLLKRTSSWISTLPVGFGVFSPEDYLNLSYEEFKRKRLKAWLESFENMFDESWKVMYEEGRRFILEKKKKEKEKREGKKEE